MENTVRCPAQGCHVGTLESTCRCPATKQFLIYCEIRAGDRNSGLWRTYFKYSFAQQTGLVQPAGLPQPCFRFARIMARAWSKTEFFDHLQTPPNHPQPDRG